MADDRVVMERMRLDLFAHNVMKLGAFVVQKLQDEDEVPVPQLLADVMLVFAALAEDTGLVEEDRVELLHECEAAVKAARESGEVRRRVADMLAGHA